MDADGYGYRPGDSGLERLLEDLRTFSPAGIERAAAGWLEHDADSHKRLHAAERAALKALEGADEAASWEDLRRAVLDLTEGRSSLVAWKAEHGDAGHRAEDATLAAGLGLLARERISRADYETLVSGLAEALPWLLLAD